MKLFLPSVFISQNASTGIPGFIEDIQYLPLGDLPSLILISLQDSAASSEMEPSGTEIEKLSLFIFVLAVFSMQQILLNSTYLCVCIF